MGPVDNFSLVTGSVVRSPAAVDAIRHIDTYNSSVFHGLLTEIPHDVFSEQTRSVTVDIANV